MAEIYEAAGFAFSTKELADTAIDEEKKIYYIRSRLNYNDMASVQVIYNKMLKGNVFKTPVGYMFLKELHDELIKDPGIINEEIDSIPYDTPEAVMSAGEKYFRSSFKEKKVKTYKKEYRICRIIIAALAVCVLAMFYITMTADNPNILNYETSIQNKYSAWEQELREREGIIREKEAELSIDN